MLDSVDLSLMDDVIYPFPKAFHVIRTFRANLLSLLERQTRKGYFGYKLAPSYCLCGKLSLATLCDG